MKLMKKAIAAVSSITLLASIAVMPAVHAEGATLKLVATPDEAKAYVDVTISYSGVEAKQQVAGIVVPVDADYFELAECPEDYYGDYYSAACEGELEGWSTDLATGKQSNMTSSYDAGNLKFAYSTSKTTAPATLPEAQENLVTIRMIVKDGAESKIWTDGYEFKLGDSSIGTTYSTRNGSLTLDTTDAVIKGEDPGPEPKDETIKATGDEEATDKAVGLGKEFESITGDLEYKLTATKGGDKFDFVKTFAMALVEGKAKVGVIVTYNGADYDDAELAFVGMK